MPSIIQRRLQQAGLSRQTSGKGTAATAATYGYGTDGGSIAKLDLDENEIPLTWSNRDVLAYDRKGIKPGQDLGALATPALTGLLLIGILGSDAVTSTPLTVTAATNSTTTITATVSSTTGIVAGQQIAVASATGGTWTNINGTWTVASVVSGTQLTFVVTTAPTGTYTASSGTITAAYTHTITESAVLPYLTAWGLFGTADWYEQVDSKVTSLELSWENAGKVMLKHQILGCTPSLLGSAYTVTNLEVPSQVGYFTAGGGTFTVGGTSFIVTGGTIKMDTHIDNPVSSASVLPSDVIEGKLEVSYSLKIKPTSTALWRETIFNSGAAGALTTVSAFPQLGAVSCAFTSPFGSLTISSPETRFMVDFPEGNPDGGAAELTFAGIATLPATGSATQAVLVNQTPSY